MLKFLSFKLRARIKTEMMRNFNVVVSIFCTYFNCDKFTMNSTQSKLFQLFQINALSYIFIVISSSLENILLQLKIVNAGSKSSSQYLVIIW